MPLPKEIDMPSQEEIEFIRSQMTVEQKSNMRLFIAALRSGKFKQGYSRLTTIAYSEGRDAAPEEFYCCLGVACKVAMNNGLPLAKGIQWFDEGYDAVIYGYTTTLLPVPVQAWLGLQPEYNYRWDYGFNPPLWDRGESISLETATGMNDTHRYSFARIADAFEYTYLPEDVDRKANDE